MIDLTSACCTLRRSFSLRCRERPVTAITDSMVTEGPRNRNVSGGEGLECTSMSLTFYRQLLEVQAKAVDEYILILRLTLICFKYYFKLLSSYSSVTFLTCD